MQPKPEKILSRTSVIRPLLAVAVVLAVFIYILAVVLSRIPVQQKLGVADIAIVVLATGIALVLLRPELSDRISHFKLENWSWIGCRNSKKSKEAGR